LTGSSRYSNGDRSTWVTPLFHAETDSQGGMKSMHLLNYFQGPDYQALIPLAWRSGAAGARHHGFLPFWVSGPRYWSFVPLLTGSYRYQDGDRSTMVTPLLFRHSDAAGETEYMHCLNYFQAGDFKTLFPVYWRWRTDDSVRTIIPWLYTGVEKIEGDAYRSLLFPLSCYHTGDKLNTKFPFQLYPFILQRAGADYEVSLLWRIFHTRKQDGVLELEVAPIVPLWWSEHVKEAPAKFQVLGGLFARDCDHKRRKYRYRALWAIPITGSRSY